MPDYLHGVEIVTVEDAVRPIQTIRSSVIGLVGTAPDATAAAFPLNTPVLVSTRGGFAGIGADGTLPKALAGIFEQFSPFVVVIRVAEGASEIETRANIIGGTNVTTGARTGIHALRDAQSTVGVTPMILIAPGFTSARPSEAANPVVTALSTVADQLLAHCVVAGPNTTDAAALAYREDFGSRRIYIVDPFVKVYDASTGLYVSEDPAARVAGTIARIDHERGFWKSPSNEVINGIGGLDRPIDYALGDPSTRANLLNENEIATFIRDDGWRLWGSRTAAPTGDTFAFLPVSRTKDMIDISIQRAHRWACDEAITRNYYEAVTNSVNSYLRQLQMQGAILGGSCWVDPDFNTKADVTGGKATFSYDFTAAYPAEHVIFRSTITDKYISTLIASS